MLPIILISDSQQAQLLQLGDGKQRPWGFCRRLIAPPPATTTTNTTTTTLPLRPLCPFSTICLDVLPHSLIPPSASCQPSNSDTFVQRTRVTQRRLLVRVAGVVAATLRPESGQRGAIEGQRLGGDWRQVGRTSPEHIQS